MKRVIAITCEALARSTYALAAVAPHTVTIRLLRQGLHNTPRKLRAALQAEIDAIQPGECDAILLIYGICGTSTLGLTARHTPLVMARAHDCITLYLGSHARYQAEFDAQPGTYWYSLDYMERSGAIIGGPNAGFSAAAGLGANTIGQMENVYEDYVAKYGQDNADYLMEVMGEWGQHYQRAVYIDMGSGDGKVFEQMAQDQAQQRGWVFERRQGDTRLLQMMINGEWPTSEFLIVPPGHTIQQAGADGLIPAVPPTPNS